MAQTVDCSYRLRRARRRAFSIGPKEARQTCGPNDQGHIDFRSKEIDGQILFCRTIERPRQEGNIRKGRFISPERPLILGTPIGKIKNRSWQFTASKVTHAVNIESLTAPVCHCDYFPRD
jgi:hypothetical protein